MEIDLKIAAEMQLARFAQKTNGLRMTETHVKVLTLLDQTDKFTLLGLIDDMVDDLTRNGVRALGQNVHNLSKRQALLLLGDLRRWFVTCYCNDVVACCDKLREWQRKAMTLAAENAGLKALFNNGWTNRVTFENMVEQIASNEFPAQRDEFRMLVEPMLKKDMVLKFRESIKQKAHELHGSSGSNITIEQAEVKVQSPGNNIAHTIYTKE